MLLPLMLAGTRRSWFLATTLVGVVALASPMEGLAAEPKVRNTRGDGPAARDVSDERESPGEKAMEAPLVDDLDRARTLTPPPGGLSGSIEAKKEPEAPRIARETASVVFHARWVTLPGAIFKAFFKDYQSLSQPSFGAAYEWGDLDGEMWAVELDWSGLTTDAGNWLETATPPSGASYAEPGLHMISVDAMYRKQFPITGSFRAMLGGGLGLGILLGDIETAEVLPTCVEPVSKCAHWPGATDETAELPTRIVPIVHITGAFELDLGEGFTVRLQGGFRDLFYAGLSVGKTL